MKKSLFRGLMLCLLLCFSLVLFAACNEKDTDDTKKSDTDTSSSEEITEPSCDNGHQYDTNGVCIVCEDTVPYRFDFTSNGDGTCYLSRVYTYRVDQEYTLEIPTHSPAGDLVTGIDCPDFESLVPKMLLPADFEEMRQKLQDLVDQGEIDRFYKSKFESYFTFQSLESRKSEKAKNQLLQQYPIAEITDFYVLIPDASVFEERWLLSYLWLIEYEKDDLLADYQNLWKLVNESDSENKEQIKRCLPDAFPALSHNITEVKLPEAVEMTDLSFFQSLFNLERLEIPKGIAVVNGFKWSELREVVIPDTVTEIGTNAFASSLLKQVTIPSSVKKIGSSAFEGCSQLESVTLEQGLEEIGFNAFYLCSALTEITLPSSVTKIGKSAFGYCENLESVTLKDGLQTIGDKAFQECEKLRSLTIPASVQKIGQDAFSGCPELLSLENSVQYVGNWAVYYDANDTAAKLTLRDGTVGIANGAFDNSTYTEIVLPTSLRHIGNAAFQDCASLQKIVIPEGVEALGEIRESPVHTDSQRGIFEGCSALESIVIPKSVKQIGDYTFCHCDALQTIYYSGSAQEWELVEKSEVVGDVWESVNVIFQNN